VHPSEAVIAGQRGGTESDEIDLPAGSSHKRRAQAKKVRHGFHVRHPQAGGNPANPEVLGVWHEQPDVREPLWKLAPKAQHHLAPRDLILMRRPVQTLEVRMTLVKSALNVVYLSHLGVDTAQVLCARPKELWCGAFTVHGVSRVFALTRAQATSIVMSARR
jgi:hypothetical protein